ncbi:MAG: adenylyl-sulfate kinase [Oscillibacter sp.]|nr:adenylyl-sulfate kinase [Oscillibacter sp.]
MPNVLSQINELVRTDPAAFAARCDEAYTKAVERAARRIAERRGESRVILLSGASGAGKTTTALKIEEQLDRMGIETYTVSMDNYFKTLDPETAPRNQEGDIDFESPFCLDVDLLNRHFAMLDEGQTIHVPRYEFARQRRSDTEAQPLRLGEAEMAIFEGIHALNDIIVGKNPRAFRLHVSARRALVDGEGNVVFDESWLRLCRRIVRDYQFRGLAAEFTLRLWPAVRRGERLYVSTFKENALLTLDTSLAFECSALKPFVVPLLQEVSAGDFPVAESLLRAFDRIEPLDDRYIAPTSLAREFIGGSSYNYSHH